MAVATAPALVTSTRPIAELMLSTHRGHALQKVGHITCTNPRGTADIWYCATDHQLLADTVST